MRKLLYVLTIATFSFAIMACRQITLAVNGAKKPKIETPDHMETFLHSTGCTEAKTAILKFDALPSAIANGMIPTQVYVFDKAGNGLKLPGATNKCAPDPSIFIQNLDPSKQYKKDSSLDLMSMVDLLNTTHNIPLKYFLPRPDRPGHKYIEIRSVGVGMKWFVMSRVKEINH